MRAHIGYDTDFDLKAYGAALAEQLARKHACPSCGRDTFPRLEYNQSTGEFRHVERCHMCGYAARGGTS